MHILREIYDYRAMVFSLVKRDLRGRYKASVLGFLWTFILPLCQLAIYTVVFSTIMRAGIDKFYLYLFVALIPWNFFSGCLTGGASSIVAQQSLITKIYFPREVIPIAYTTSGFINMLLCYIIVFIVCFFSGVKFSFLGLICLPAIMIIEYLIALGFTMIVSAVTVYLRDIEHILGIVSMGWMFLTPIMYPMTMVPENLQPIFNLNPMTLLVSAYRDIMYYGSVPNGWSMLILLGFGVVMTLVGFLIFGRLKRRFAEEM